MNFGAEGGTDAGWALGGGAGLDDGGGVPLGPVAAEAPSPVNCTVCKPEPSSPVICQAPLADPALLGANVMDSVRVWPGSIAVPSGRLVVAVKAAPNGGFDFSIVTVELPDVLIVNVWSPCVPIETVPKSTASLESWSSPGAAAEATGRSAGLAVGVSRLTASVNLPSEVGSNATPTVTLSPGRGRSPALGRPVIENGALGDWTSWTVSAWPPTLL